MRRVVLVLATLVLAACGGGGGAPAPGGDPSPTGGPASPEPGSATPGSMPGAGGTLTGTLGGDPTLEGGCAWLETDGTRYEILWPDGWQVAFDPLRLTDPDGTVVAGQADTLHITGMPATGMVSVCQVGELFEATQVVAPD